MLSSTISFESFGNPGNGEYEQGLFATGTALESFGDN